MMMPAHPILAVKVPQHNRPCLFVSVGRLTEAIASDGMAGRLWEWPVQATGG